MEKEAVHLEYNGKTITAYVDKNIADALKNDPVQKKFYSKSVLEALESNSEVKLVPVNKSDESASYMVHENCATPEKISWTKEATSLLINLRRKMKDLFNAKNSLKKQLWADIAEKLQDTGFFLGDDPSERCRQKFVNIRHQYLNYLRHMYNPEKGQKKPHNKYQSFFENSSRKPPQFFEEMQEILGNAGIPFKIPRKENVYQMEYYSKSLENFLTDDDEDNSKDEPTESDEAIMEHSMLSLENKHCEETPWTIGSINLLIRFRSELDTLFNQENNDCKALWNEIAQKLKTSGFDLGKDSGNKCALKFESMVGKYEEHKLHTIETNSIPNMPFYNELDQLLSKTNEDLTEPVQMSDEEDSLVTDEDINDENCETIILNTVETEIDENTDSNVATTNLPSHETDRFFWPDDAVLMLIELRDELSHAFDAKKGSKKDNWQKIAVKLNEAGFEIGNGERCRQKFANLQLRYFSHLNALKINQYKPVPQFFNEFHNLMKKIGKASSVLDEDFEEVNDAKGATYQKKRLKSNSEKLIDVLVKLHKEDQKERQKQFNELKALLVKQTEQQERLLNIFEQSFCTS